MLKRLKPITPGQRGRTVVDYSVLTSKKPEKSLTSGFKRRRGRATSGRITTRHKGGGNKRLYREIDFKQNKFDIPARVASIEYDPNRSAFIALLCYADGEKRYIIATKSMKVGDNVITSENAPLKEGNRIPVGKIPTGYFVSNVELQPGKGGQIIRSAGSSAQVMASEGGYTHILLPSKEIRKIEDKCFVTIGVVSNHEYNLANNGKAGASRWRGIRPTVRGSAMNPVDHPHGGGEGRQEIGLKYPKTPWGKHALGKKTRNKKKASNKFIVKTRANNKKRK